MHMFTTVCFQNFPFPVFKLLLILGNRTVENGAADDGEKGPLSLAPEGPLGDGCVKSLLWTALHTVKGGPHPSSAPNF